MYVFKFVSNNYVCMYICMYVCTYGLPQEMF